MQATHHSLAMGLKSRICHLLLRSTAGRFATADERMKFLKELRRLMRERAKGH